MRKNASKFIIVIISVSSAVALYFVYLLFSTIIGGMRIENAYKSYDKGGKEVLLSYAKNGNFMIYDVALNRLAHSGDENVSVDVAEIMLELEKERLERILVTIEYFNDKRTIPMLARKHKEYVPGENVNDINMALLIDQTILTIQGLDVSMVKNRIYSYSFPKSGYLKVVFQNGTAKYFKNDQEITQAEYESVTNS